MPTQRSRTQMKYDKEKCRHYSLKLNLRIDADIIEKLNSQPSIRAYIKQLVRADIKANYTSLSAQEENT